MDFTPSGPPALTAPRLGDPIARDGDCAYVKRASADNQARTWNTVLASDPVFGPSSGLCVGQDTGFRR